MPRLLHHISVRYPTSTSMAFSSPKIHFSHSQTCVFYAVNASWSAFKAVLRTFLKDVGASRVLNERPIKKYASNS